jgi:hypothetical protein
LDDIGFGCCGKVYDAVTSFTPKMLDKMAELAVIGHVLVGGRNRIIESTALIFAIDPKESKEKDIAKELLRSIDPRHVEKNFRMLIRIGFLSRNYEELFFKLQQELSLPRVQGTAIRSGQPEITVDDPKKSNSHGSFSDQEELRRGLREAADRATTRPPCPISVTPAYGTSISSNVTPIPERPSPRKKKKRRNGNTSVCWDSREELPDITDAAQLRSIDLKNKKVSEKMMYRIICIFGFRISGQKASIGENYSQVVNIQQRIMNLLKGDKCLQRLFEKCWDNMIHNNAMYRKKRGEVASLPSKISNILDSEIRDVVAWALLENRRLTS